MAATGRSSASATQYHVFLSFRGPDTRNTFTDYLYRTMVGQGIVAYRDSEELHAGDRIDDLLRAVGKSKICIPILSRGYASSAWCLRELARVTELHESTGKPEILPIFFDVTPTDVKLRTELYLNDLEKHEQRHGADNRQQWEAALGKVAEIKGWEVQGKAQGEVIELIVKEVLHKLKVRQRRLDNKLVGVDKQVEAIMDLLDVDSGTGVRFVGIYGMGGIGKTTLAKIVFNKLCAHFDGKCSFIGNIRESSNRYGLVDLQKQLALDISDSRFVENFIHTDEGIDSITRRASSKKVLIVLDDLDKKEQLKELVGGSDTFGSGSRILITTRDKRILDEKEGIFPYEVKNMDGDKALELFSLHAFKSVSPPNTHLSLSQEVVSTTGGLPLALEVIGSSLCRKDIRIWKEMLERLKKVPHNEVRDKLKISYDALEEMKKEIFLDIACFFINEKKSMAAYFWEACDLFPHTALDELTDLCLIKIVNGDGIWMHDQLGDLGRDIVRQECTRNLTACNRLWNDKEALKVVRWKERKDNVQALNLGGYHSDPISVMDEELERMPNLKLLRLYAVTFVGDINNYLKELRWLSWDSPPLDCKMVNLHLKNLVVFILSNNENTEDWGGWNILKMTNKLKVFSLATCRGLKWTPDFSGCLSLEILSLGHCPNLQEVDSSIGKLKGLTHLQLHGCGSLQNLPKEIGGLVNVKDFSISSCGSLRNLPKEIGGLVNVKHFSISSCGSLRNLPKEIGGLVNVKDFSISSCGSLQNLPKEIGGLVNVKHFSISWCGSLRNLPKEIGGLVNVKHFSISSCDSLRNFPKEIGGLVNVTHFSIDSCGSLRNLPKEIGGLVNVTFFSISWCPSLRNLPKEIGGLVNVTFFSILSCGNLRNLPKEIGGLVNMTHFSIHLCGSLRNLPKEIGGLVNMTHFSIHLCGSLRNLPKEIGGLVNMRHFYIGSCGSLRNLPEEIGGLVNVEHFSINSCSKIKTLPNIGKLASLFRLDISQTKITSLPDSIGNAKNLSSLSLSGTLVAKLPISIGELTQLKFLSLSNCQNFVELPESIGYLTKLQKLDLSRTKIVELFDSIKNIKQLKVMRTASCPIQRLPVNIGMQESMEELNVRNCQQLAGELPIAIGKVSSPSILDISRTCVCAVPTTIKSLTQLQELDLSFCNELQELPKLPSSLNYLRVRSTSLRLVPDLGYLMNLVALELSTNFGRALAQASNLQLQWVGKLSKLEQLELCLSDLPVPSMELGCLPRLKNLTLPRMDSFDSVVVGPQVSHLKNLSTLHLCCCPLREIQLDGLELLGDLTVTYCEFLEGLSVISSSLRKLSRMKVGNCPKLLQIRFLNTMESLEHLEVGHCESLGGLYGLSNSKKLKTLTFNMCPVLWVIEGLEELELLQLLYFITCPSLKVLTNLSNSKIPNECMVRVSDCKELPYCWYCLYGDYREEILDWTRRGLNQEGAARFSERGQPLIVQMLKKLEVPYDTLPNYYGTFATLKWTGYLSLETLYFHYCLNLREFDSSVGKMKVLTHLDIIQCMNLRTLPEEIGGLVNLMYFSIKKCSQLEKLPYSIGKLGSLSKLDISSSRIATLPDSIGNAKHLSFLNLSSTPIVELPISIGEFMQLEFLSLKYCRNLRELPESIGNLTSLQKLNLLGTNIVELPDSIINLKQLKVMRVGFSPIRRLPASIEMLEKLEELYAEHCEQLAGELPSEIGKLLSLRILDISYTRISVVPMAIGYLTRLQKLDLTHCNELQELPKLPSSLHCLRVHSASLWLVPDFGNLTNLVEMLLSNGFGQAPAQPSNPMQTFQLQWVEKLFKLEKLSWDLSDFPISSTELGCLPGLKELTLSGMDNFDSIVVGPQFSNLKNLSILCLHSSPLREIQLDGLELLRNLAMRECEFLEQLSVISLNLRKLYKMEVLDCPKLLEIQFPCTMESLEELRVGYCDSLGGLHGLSNSKKLKALRIYQCDGLRVVEGLEELELLGFLYLSRCGSLERLTDVSDSKIPNECVIEVWGCIKLSSYEGTYQGYKEIILVRTRMTFNEEDAGETDAEESVMDTNNYYSQNLPLTIGFLWSPEPDTELDSTGLNNSQVPPRTTSSDVSGSSCSIL